MNQYTIPTNRLAIHREAAMDDDLYTIPTKVRGVTFKCPLTGIDRQKIIKRYVHPGDSLKPVLEPDNPYGSNAIGLWLFVPKPDGSSETYHIGYIGSELSSSIAPILREGKHVTITVTDVTGKGEQTRGVNIALRSPAADEARRIVDELGLEPDQAGIAEERQTKKTGKVLLIIVGAIAILFLLCVIITALLGDAGMPIVVY
jgi:hypothetical protein